MYDDDRHSPKSEIPDAPSELEVALAEYDWTSSPSSGEVAFDNIKHALAVLTILEMEGDEDYEQYGSLWLH